MTTATTLDALALHIATHSDRTMIVPFVQFGGRLCICMLMMHMLVIRHLHSMLMFRMLGSTQIRQ